MKTLKQILIVIFGLGILSSCSSVKNANSSLIIGSWKPVKISVMPPGQDVKDASAVSDKIELHNAAADIAGNAGNTDKEFAENLVNVQSKVPDIKSSIEFRKNKTATYTFKDKTVNGTWKMDTPGKTVTFTGNDASGTMVFEILKIDSQVLRTIERYPQGEVTINYFKK